MPALLDDVAMRVAFSDYENRGVYALLLGSGLSRSAEIPTGWEITLDLIRRVAELRGEGGQADYVESYRDTTGEEPDYSRVVGELGLSRDERRSILHTYIEPTDDDRREGLRIPCKVATCSNAKLPIWTPPGCQVRIEVLDFRRSSISDLFVQDFFPAGPDGIRRPASHSLEGLFARATFQTERIAVLPVGHHLVSFLAQP